jgi:hypothetical protein
MKIEKQPYSIEIRDHDIDVNTFRKHGKLFEGSSKRSLVVGPSGCGKTNVIISLIEDPNGLRFTNLYIYSKSLYQPKYEYLRKLFKSLNEIGYFESEDEESIISPKEIKLNSMIVFDDIVCCNQNIVKDYFCFGRHKNVDCFYLCQTYSSIPKQLIRDNANLLIIFKQDLTNLKHIYDDHVNVDMSFQNFKDLCLLCWKDKYGFLVIDKDSNISSGRYRKGFDSFIRL